MTNREDGFEVVDKRRTSDEAGPSQPEAAATASTEPEPSADGTHAPEEVEDAAAQLEGEEQVALDVPSLLGYILGLLGSAAWQAMGAIINPATGKAEADLAQARLAIDTFEVVAEKFIPFVPEPQQRELRGALADMRLNYVERRSPATREGRQ